jgi:hypothetical protein
MTPLMQRVMAILSLRRFSLEDEKRTQAEIAEALDARVDTWQREVRIAGGIIDFVAFGEIGIEVKIKGAPKDIRRQLEGYAAEQTLSGLVLVSSKPVSLPAEINGKPVAQLNLGRAWL